MTLLTILIGCNYIVRYDINKTMTNSKSFISYEKLLTVKGTTDMGYDVCGEPVINSKVRCKGCIRGEYMKAHKQRKHLTDGGYIDYYQC